MARHCNFGCGVAPIILYQNSQLFELWPYVVTMSQRLRKLCSTQRTFGIGPTRATTTTTTRLHRLERIALRETTAKPLMLTEGRNVALAKTRSRTVLLDMYAPTTMRLDANEISGVMTKSIAYGTVVSVRPIEES